MRFWEDGRQGEGMWKKWLCNSQTAAITHLCFIAYVNIAVILHDPSFLLFTTTLVKQPVFRPHAATISSWRYTSIDDTHKSIWAIGYPCPLSFLPTSTNSS